MSVLEVVLLKVKKEVENLDCQYIGVDQQTLRQCCLNCFTGRKIHVHTQKHILIDVGGTDFCHRRHCLSRSPEKRQFKYSKDY